MLSHTLLRSAISSTVLALFATTASAQAAPAGLPAGAARIVVGFAPGGAADTAARVLAEAMRKEGMTEVLVENRPGASSRLAVAHVKNAPPDGLTMLLTTSAAFTLFPYAYKSLQYDPDDLRPVAQIVDIPTTFVAGIGQPYNDLKEFIEWAKKNPSQANLGLAAQGSTGHFGSIQLGKDIGLAFTPVVYRGASPMLVDVAAGQVATGYDAVASMMALHAAKKIKFLGVTGAKRLAQLPDVPTAKELGFPQFEHAMPFYAVYVPSKTPDATVVALQKVLLAALKHPEVVTKLEGAGFLVAPLDAKQTTDRIKTERKFWEPVIKAAGLSLE